jgi:hypothetical protein|tara:strand:+ start:127 stop:645 length:519 start_codon:yes stop_codon:yes gene_type:complete
MAIAASDIKLRISGASASATDPNGSYGGAMSTVSGGIIVTNVLNNDMDDITSAEASSGITIYHNYYYKNEHATLTYISPKFYIDTQTNSGDTSVAMALVAEAKNVATTRLTNETTAPSGITFTTPANYAGGIAIGSLDAADYRGIWVKYIVGSSASAVLDAYTLGIQGDSNP